MYLESENRSFSALPPVDLASYECDVYFVGIFLKGPDRKRAGSRRPWDRQHCHYDRKSDHKRYESGRSWWDWHSAGTTASIHDFLSVW